MSLTSVMSHFRPRRAVRTAGLTLGLITLAVASSAEIQQQSSGGVITLSNEQSAKPRTKKAARPAVFMPADKSPSRYSRYDVHIRSASALYQIPEELVRAVIKVESDYDPRAVSPANARGLMQMIPQTAERMMVTDIFDPRQNIYGGVRYLRILANLFNGDLELTIAAYNAGEHAVIRHGGIPPYEETQHYVTKVLSYYHHYRATPPR